MWQALRHMHALGIAHLDVSLRNALVDPATLDVCLIDFGFSRCFDEGQYPGNWGTDGTCKVTARYAAVFSGCARMHA